MKRFFTLLLMTCLMAISTSAFAAISIADNETGGDCQTYGVWDWNTKTCTLTTDIDLPLTWWYDPGIIIANSNITLDGNGHTLSGNQYGYGIYIDRLRYVTVKNLNIVGFWGGVYLYLGGYHNIIDNTIDSANYAGVWMKYSGSNQVNRNAITNNATHGIAVWWVSNSNTIEDNFIDSNGYGVMIYWYIGYNNVINNYISNNRYSGVGMYYYASGNNIHHNTIINNDTGITISSYCSSNSIYNNNIVDNNVQAISYSQSDNYFALQLPTGGNYWSDYDSADEGCSDLDDNKICDAPYKISTYYLITENDLLAWTSPDAWLCSDAPVIAFTSTSPEAIWPPNRKMTDITVSGSVEIQASCEMPQISYTLADEYGTYSGSGSVALNSDGTFVLTLPVEAWRDGGDTDGRIYSVTIEATGQSGSDSKTADFKVPHNQ